MRQTHVCPKCRNDHLLLVAAVPDTGESADPLPMKVAFAAAKKGFFSDNTLERVGHLEAVVCRRCGYTELYTRDPESIPVDGKNVREVVGKAHGSPP